jgi:formylglycine-generating enzyme required for sulfatase activity
VPTDVSSHRPFEPRMVLIPAGGFLMGSDAYKDRNARDNEIPQHLLYLPDYYLAKTAVTNGQYRTFVSVAGHAPPEHWEGRSPPGGKENHPVVNVSWHDATAFCGWLSKVTGKPYRLPSEAEWEKGARGSDGRLFPWGDVWDGKRCNSGEDDHADTTPVGACPQGASPYGLLDMSGNVWEWTLSLWGSAWKEPSFKYPYDPTDGREDLEAGESIIRILRGGSWLVPSVDARTAYRNGFLPDHRFNTIGFRCCMSSTPSG